MADRELVTVRRACEIMHCQRSAVYGMCRRGDIEHVVTPTGRFLIYADKLLRPGGRQETTVCPTCGRAILPSDGPQKN